MCWQRNRKHRDPISLTEISSTATFSNLLRREFLAKLRNQGAMDSVIASTKEQMRDLAGKSRTMTTIDDIRDRQNRSLHSAISDGFDSCDYETDMPASQRVTLDDVVHLPNKAHNALADGFERIAHAMDMPDRNCVSLDEVMLHQNRVLHNEDGFQSEDYMK